MRPLIACIDPDPADLCLSSPGREHIDRRVIGMDGRACSDMPPDRLGKRLQQGSRFADPVRECGALQLNTFVINYRGHPYMESLRENKPLCYSSVFTATFMIILTFGIAPEINTEFSLLVLPNHIQNEVFIALLLDSVLTFLIDRVLLFICGDAKLKPLY